MRLEYNAFLARVRAHPVLSNKTDTVVRTDSGGNPVRANYVVVFPAIPDGLGDDRYTALQAFESDRFLSFDVRVVAVDADGLLMLIEAVMGQLIGHTLVVSGRRCDPIRMATDAVEEGTAKFDRDARLFYADLSFEFWSRRG